MNGEFVECDKVAFYVQMNLEIFPFASICILWSVNGWDLTLTGPDHGVGPGQSPRSNRAEWCLGYSNQLKILLGLVWYLGIIMPAPVFPI